MRYEWSSWHYFTGSLWILSFNFSAVLLSAGANHTKYNFITSVWWFIELNLYLPGDDVICVFSRKDNAHNKASLGDFNYSMGVFTDSHLPVGHKGISVNQLIL